MAKIFAIPEQFEASKPFWSLEKDRRENLRIEAEWLEKLSQWCKTHGSGEYAGEIVRDQVADGYAQYMVFSLRPLRLIHIPLLDGYQSRWAHRWTVADVKQMVEQRRAMDALFSRNG